jgi:hypothetical protein
MGVDPKTLSDRIGHANMSVTMQIYAHRSQGRSHHCGSAVGGALNVVGRVAASYRY